MGRLGGFVASLALGLGPCLAPPVAASEPRAGLAALVAVDEGFAPVAAALVPLFMRSTGHEAILQAAPTAALYARLRDGAGYDLLLAADRETPARLVAEGLGQGDSVITYAVAARHDSGETVVQDAVLLRAGVSNPAARAFLDFLESPEAWDVIVSHGFGAH